MKQWEGGWSSNMWINLKRHSEGGRTVTQIRNKQETRGQH